MQIVIAATIFFTVTTFFAGLFGGKKKEKVDLQDRLRQVINIEETMDFRQEQLSRPLFERLMRPLLNMLSLVATKVLPASMLQNIEKKVQLTGVVGAFSAKDFLGLKAALALGLPFLYYQVAGIDNALGFLVLIFSCIIGWKVPDMHLDNKARARINIMEKSFPDIMDLLTVSVEAGLGFDGAMMRVAEKSKGPIAVEFRRIMHEVKMGKSRREALRDFGERSGVDDIRTFTGAIIQADQLGLNIGNTLKLQAEQMRRKRRQRIEEQAMKVPVKMLIPLVVFIFPTIFIVLLGPAVIQIIDNFLGW